MSDKQNDALKDNLLEWLNERGVTMNDILQDKDGLYYVMQEVNDTGEFKPEFLPDQFQEMAL